MIGYRGSGKSTIGRRLAEQFSLDFVDTDCLIEERAGATIQEMVKTRGWPYFRALEKEVIRDLAASHSAVVAAGGGAILDPDNQASLKRGSLVIYLTASETVLAARIAGDGKTEGQRPSLTGDSVTAEISAVLRERDPLYRKVADHSLSTSRKSIDEVVAEIAEIIRALPA